MTTFYNKGTITIYIYIFVSLVLQKFKMGDRV